MSLLWIIKIVTTIFLYLFVFMYSFFIRNREKYAKYLENFSLNLLLVIGYNILCYIPVILPSDPNIILKPSIFDDVFVVLWNIFLGLGILIFAFSIWIPTLKMRKVLGAQDTEGKLFTNGIYSFCRHPIYLGISLIILGFALILNNFDGLIIYPLLLLVNLFTGKIEEKYDIGPRFKDEYPQYKQQTRMFGPIWFWMILVGLICFPFIIASIFL